MQITEIKRTISFGEFQNISMTGQIVPGESIHAARLELERLIYREIEDMGHGKRIFHDVEALSAEKSRLEYDISVLREECREIQSLLSAFSGWIYDHSVPF